MKCRIFEDKSIGRVPMVGQSWKFIGSSEVYMRINDKQGGSAMDFDPDEEEEMEEGDMLYSVSLESGKISFSHISDPSSIQILHPMKVDDDTIVFGSTPRYVSVE